MPVLRTPEQAKAWLRGQGITITDFAKQHDLPLHTVYKILSGGAYKGYSGAAHRAAVALGIKTEISCQPEHQH